MTRSWPRSSRCSPPRGEGRPCSSRGCTCSRAAPTATSTSCVGRSPRFAGVKVVGDFVSNHERGLPSELALLLLMDPQTGVPQAILDATAITEMRTGAVTAIGARHLAPAGARMLGAHRRARHRLLERAADRPGAAVAGADPRALTPTGEPRGVRRPAARGSWSADRGRDRLGVVRARRRRRRRGEPADRADAVAEDRVDRARRARDPYGTVSAVELNLTDAMDKIVVDDWGQAGAGPLGALRAHVDSGRLTRENLHAELGQIVCGARPGRESTTRRSCSGTAGCRHRRRARRGAARQGPHARSRHRTAVPLSCPYAAAALSRPATDSRR